MESAVGDVAAKYPTDVVAAAIGLTETGDNTLGVMGMACIAPVRTASQRALANASYSSVTTNGWLSGSSPPAEVELPIPTAPAIPAVAVAAGDGSGDDA